MSTKRKAHPPSSPSDDDVLQCVICMEGCSADTSCVLSCTHRFHSTCIHHWLLVTSSCPICREPVDTRTCSRGELKDHAMPVVTELLHAMATSNTTLKTELQAATDRITCLELLLSDFVQMPLYVRLL